MGKAPVYDETGQKRMVPLTMERICHDLESLGWLHCTYEEVAAWLSSKYDLPIDLGKDDVEYFFRQNEKAKAAFERGKGKSMISLRRKQIQKAMDGDTSMLIWCGKNLLGQKDRQQNEHTGEDGKPIKMIIKWADE